jgi:hypothetical protein
LLKDRFGVSWQIAPSVVQEIMEGPDIQKSQRVVLALYRMKKIDFAADHAGCRRQMKVPGYQNQLSSVFCPALTVNPSMALSTRSSEKS